MSDRSTDLTVPADAREYLAVLWRRKWIVFGVTAIVVALGAGRSYRQTPVYRASGQVVLTSANQANSIQTQMRVIESAAVHDLAARKVKGIGSVQTQQAGLGNVITVWSDNPNASMAAKTVNTTIDVYQSYAQQQNGSAYAAASSALHDSLTTLQHDIDQLTTRIQSGTAKPGNDLTVRRDALISQQSALQQRLDDLRFNAATGSGVTVIARPTRPTIPIKPKLRDDILIAFGAGLFLGIALAFASEYFSSNGASSTSRDPSEVSEELRRATADVALMGVIPSGKPSVREVVSLSAPHSDDAQSYRALHNAASFMGLERGRCLEVTSAPDREGKTETLANLAVLLARAGRRVIVVDCDLREPRVHEYFGLDNDTGFTSVMRGGALADALQRVPDVDHLYALTSGPLSENPDEMLASSRCADVLGALLVGGTLVLIDTPPMLPHTDALTLAKTAPVDGIVLVATAKTGAQEHLRHALDALHSGGAPTVGVALTSPNGVRDPERVEHPRGRWWRRRRSTAEHPHDTETWQAVMRAFGYNPDTSHRSESPVGRNGDALTTMSVDTMLGRPRHASPTLGTAHDTALHDQPLQ